MDSFVYMYITALHGWRCWGIFKKLPQLRRGVKGDWIEERSQSRQFCPFQMFAWLNDLQTDMIYYRSERTLLKMKHLHFRGKCTLSMETKQRKHETLTVQRKMYRIKWKRNNGEPVKSHPHRQMCPFEMMKIQWIALGGIMCMGRGQEVFVACISICCMILPLPLPD